MSDDFLTLVRADAEAILGAELAQTVVYHFASDPDGPGRSMPGVFQRGAVGLDDAQTGRREEASGVLTLSTDADTGVPSWSPDDHVVIDGERWEVVSALGVSIALVDLELKRVSQVDRSGPDHRRR